MRDGRYDYAAVHGRIGGVLDARGWYHVVEGHHRMAAALEIYREKGDAEPIRELLRWGRWDVREHGPAYSRPFPLRGWWGALRNWLGF